MSSSRLWGGFAMVTTPTAPSFSKRTMLMSYPESWSDGLPDELFTKTVKNIGIRNTGYMSILKACQAKPVCRIERSGYAFRAYAALKQSKQCAARIHGRILTLISWFKIRVFPMLRASRVRLACAPGYRQATCEACREARFVLFKQPEHFHGAIVNSKASSDVTVPYHHGNLRNALIAEGRRALEEIGVHELSLRYLARKAGVSEAAPSHHFAGKEGLLAAIAADGFRDLAALRVAIAESDEAALSKAYRMMRVYVEFAQRYQGLFE